MQTRLEKDAIGPIQVPVDAYYGSFTTRALANFQITGIRAPEEVKIAYGLIKKSAAMTNAELGELEPKLAKAIIQACDEFIAGKFDDQFTLDVFQAGAGTPFNMNTNEVVANRANEILAKEGYTLDGTKISGTKGSYKPVTPNNHVNWAQSSNDVTPTAIRLAALLRLRKLLPEVQKLRDSLMKKAKAFSKILKVGRTHIQDAVPITLGQEFEAYSSAINHCLEYLKESFNHLNELGIGATALGTGITTHPKYRSLMVKNLSQLTGLKLKPTKNPMELTHGMNAFTQASNGLRVLANDLIRIANDFKLLASGPVAGINEITLPDVEPGSSIMPGKVNPSVPEAMNMIGFQVIGNDTVINLAVQGSQLELNVMTPVIMYNLMWSMELLINGTNMFRVFCVDQVKANEKRCKELLEKSLCLATGLSPYLGYKVTALLVGEALKKGQTLIDTVASHNFMSKQELESILVPAKLTKPALTDKTLATKIKANKNYQAFLKNIA
ncbi:MAG: aspartate ammonia-lyase [Candidatus Gracilibacteria bacterium]|jgi:aspartate ammonia-lyase